MQSKSERYLRMLHPEATEDFIRDFYREAGKLKSKFKIYIARHKLYDFLGFEQVRPADEPVNSD